MIVTFVFSVYLTGSVGANLPGFVDSNGWLGYTSGATGLVIAIVAPLIGLQSDSTGRPKRYVTIGTLLTVAVMACLYWIRNDSRFFGLGLLLLALGSIFHQLASVAYNSLLRQASSRSNIGRVSGFGWSMGYVGGVFILLVVYLGFVEGAGPRRGILDVPVADGLNIRATALVAALWFLMFSIPLLVFFPGAHRSEGKHRRHRLSVVGTLKTVTADFTQAYRTAPHAVRFLVAQALYTDGLSSIFAFGAVFAVTIYKVGQADVLLFGITANMVAAGGAILGGYLDDLLNPKRIITGALIGLLAATVALLFASGPKLFWIFGLSLAVFAGPIQASSRTYIFHLARPGHEGWFFGLAASTSRAMSFLAPTLIAVFTTMSGSDRGGIVGILAVLSLGLIMLLLAGSPPSHAP